jgi:hypothetical protein
MAQLTFNLDTKTGRVEAKASGIFPCDAMNQAVKQCKELLRKAARDNPRAVDWVTK